MVLFLYFNGCKEQENRVQTEIKTQNDGKKRILFFGDSLTAGMGLSSQSESFPGLIADKISKTHPEYMIVNAGLSGDTTSGGLARLDWVLDEKVDIFVLELGANDSMRGVNPSITKANLKKIIIKVREKNPEVKILLIGMQTFPNLGAYYTKEFARIFPELKKEEKVLLVPFLLQGIAGDRKLNQEDGIHPTAEGHVIMAKTVFTYLKKLL